MALTAAQQAAIQSAQARINGVNQDEEEERRSTLSPTQQAALDAARARLGAQAPQGVDDGEPSRLRGAADVGVGLVAGVPKAAGALVGLGSLVPGLNYIADPISQGLYDFGEGIDNTLLSDYQLSKNAELSARVAQAAATVDQLPEDATMRDRVAYIYDTVVAQGGEAGSYLAENPGQIINFIAQTAPHIVLGGVAGKAIKGGAAVTGVANISGRTAGAIGEGLIAGGDATANIVRDSYEGFGTEYDSGRLAGAAAGIGTSLISRGLASRFDVDTLAANGATNLLEGATKGSVLREGATGLVREAGEEFLQSGQEQAFTNVGQGKPFYENVGSSAVIGAATGAGLGAGTSVLGQTMANRQQSQLDADRAAQDAADEAILVRQQEEQARQEGLQRQVEVEAQGRVRREAAQTFTPRKEFVAAREKEIKAQLEQDVLNPQTELGAAFEQSLNENGVFDVDDVKAEAKKFVSQRQKEMKADTEAQVNDEYITALDSHVAKFETAKALTEQNPTLMEMDQTEMDLMAPSEENPAGRLAEYNIPDAETYSVIQKMRENAAKARQIVEKSQLKAAAQQGGAATNAAQEQPAKKPTKKEQLRSMAVEQLGETFEQDYPELSQLLSDGKGIYSRGKGKKSKFETMLDKAVAEKARPETAVEQEAAAEPGAQETVQDAAEDTATPEGVAEQPDDSSPVDALAGIEAQAVDYATQKLGQNWRKEQPQLVQLLKEKKYAGLQSNVDRIAEEKQAVAQQTNAVVEAFRQPLPPSVKLSQNEQKVFDVLQQAFQNNEQDEFIQSNGSLNPERIAQAAGLNSRQAAQTAITRLRPKIAKTYGVTQEQIKQRLAETKVKNVEAFDINAPTSEIDTAELNQSLSTTASANQGARDGMDQEDADYLDNMEDTPVELPSAERQAQIKAELDAEIRSNRAYAGARDTWNNGFETDIENEADRISFDDMDPGTRFEFLVRYEEFNSGDYSVDEFGAYYDDIRQQYLRDEEDAQRQIAEQESAVESQAEPEGTVEDGGQVQQTGATPSEATEQGVEDSAQLDDNAPPQTAQEFIERAKKVEVTTKKKRRPIIKKSNSFRGVTDDRPDAAYYDFNRAEDILDYIDDSGTPSEKELAAKLKPLIEEGNYQVAIVDSESLGAELVTFLNMDYYQEDPEGAANAALENFEAVSKIFNEDIPPLGLYVDTGSLDGTDQSGVILLNDGSAGPKITSNQGINNRTFLHEAVHAVTANVIYRAENGLTGNQAALEAYEDMKSLMAQVNEMSQQASVDQYAQATGLPREVVNRVVNDLLPNIIDSDVHELVAYGFTEPALQQVLDVMIVNDEGGSPSLFQKFVNTVRKALGLAQPKQGEVTAFDEVVRLTETILEARTEGRTSNETAAPKPRINMNRKHVPSRRVDTKRSDRNAAKIEAALGGVIGGERAAQVVSNAKAIYSKPLDASKPLSRFIRDAREKMPSAHEWLEAMYRSEQTVNEELLKVEALLKKTRVLGKERLAVVSDFISKSTFYQKWGYDPQWQGYKAEVDPVMKAAFDRLKPEEQEVVKEVFQYNEDMRVALEAEAESKGIKGLFGKSRLKGPYAKLGRFGNNVAVLRSQELVDAEAQLEANPEDKALREQIEEMKQQEQHFVVSFFDTPGAAEAFAVANEDKYADSDVSEKSPGQFESRVTNPEAFAAVMAALKTENLDRGTQSAIRNVVERLYFESIDEQNARTSGARRLNRAGYDKDMIRSFVSNAQAQARLLAQLRHGAEINEAYRQAEKESDKDRRELKPVFNMIARKYDNLLTRDKGFLVGVQNHITAFNSVYMLTTNVAYHAANATQPIISASQMAADFGDMSQSMGALIRGYKVAGKVIDSSFINQAKAMATLGFVEMNNTVDLIIENAPPEYQRLLKRMQLRQILDVGMEEDLNMEKGFDTGVKIINDASEGFKTMTHRMYQVARYVEAHNRVSTAVAAYDMARKNPAKLRKFKMTPEEYAIAVVEDTQGNYSAIDAPLVIDSLPKTTTQFRKFQLIMAWLWGSNVKRAFFGESKEMKAAGRRGVLYLAGAVTTLAGVTGIPFANSFVSLLSMFLGGEDEEPQDLEYWIRKNIDDGLLGDVLTRGTPAFLGIDISAKLQQRDIFYPVSLEYLNTDPGPEAAQSILMSALLGPTAGVVQNGGRFWEYMSRGDVARATEYILPKGHRSILETFRFANEGYTLKNGDVLMDPREIDLKALMFNAIGLTPMEISKIKWTYGQQYELMQYFSNEQSRIRREYVEAFDDRNSAALNELRNEWRELQRQKGRVRPFFNNARGVLNNQPVSDLLKAPREQNRRERRMQQRFN